MLLTSTRKISFYALIILLISIAPAAFSQSLKGKVTDAKSGEALVGATVSVKKDNSHKVFTTVRLDGTYLFKKLEPGNYLLQANLIGYKTTKEYSVDVADSSPAVLNVAMLNNEAVALNEISIVEHASKESERAARADEKNSNNIINVVSANAIAISPDVIISNVLGRVSGISLDRSNTGEGQHVIIRGMDKRYNTTLINGVKIPSPDNKNRFVPLDIFPADLVEKVEVSKTLTPDMEADASGGVVNLKMKTAPDHLRVDGSVSTGYGQLFINRHFTSFDPSTQASKAPGELIPALAFASPNSFPYQNLVTKSTTAPPNAMASLTIGNRYLNKKLGFIFSGTYQNSYVGNNSFYAPPVKVPGPAPQNGGQMVATAFEDVYLRQYSSKLDRVGAIASLDYKFDDNNIINLFGTYIQLNEHRVRETTDYNFGGYSYQGYRGTNAIDQLTETRSDLQNIYNAILKGEHRIFGRRFKLDWTASTSEAKHELPDVAEFRVKQLTSPDTLKAHGGYSVVSNGASTFVTPDIIYGPKNIGSESRLWRRNTDKDISAYTNLSYDAKVFGRKTTFSAGAMFRHKTRENFNDLYSLYPVTDGTSTDAPYISVPASKFIFLPQYNAQGTSYSDAGVYHFYENIQGAYGMIKYNPTDKLDVIFGIRTEQTLQHYESSSDPRLGGQSATITYTDYLPSINVKYSLTDIQAVRASAYQSIYRPTAADLIPFVDVTPDGASTSGNPNLQHTTVNNYDLRYEIFPGSTDEFMIGGFYKQLIDPIEFQYGGTSNGNGNSSIAITPGNVGEAHNYGLEVVAQKFFGDVGVSANYIYTNSTITSTKKYIAIGLSTPIFVNQVRPLQGQAAHVGNFSFLYKNAKNGLDAQLAFGYTGERINFVSQWPDLDIWEKPSLSLDFSAQKEFSKKYILFVKVNNILNTPYQLFIKQDNSSNYSGIMKYSNQQSPNYTTVEYDKYYARYLLGFRFKFR